MNMNDENSVRAVLHEALTGKPVVLDNPRVPASELLAYAEELKQKDPRYRDVQVRQAGQNRIALEFDGSSDA